jgi:chaperone required for assembly of F1-ATPase
MVCYRASGPDALVARQTAAWQPLLDWLDTAYGVTLTVTTGLMPVPQDAAALARLDARADARDDFTLTALALAVQATGSFVVGLALIEGVFDADQAFAAAIVDEDYQAGQWGRDADAEQRRAAQLAEIRAIARFLALLRQDPCGGTARRADATEGGYGTSVERRDA